MSKKQSHIVRKRKGPGGNPARRGGRSLFPLTRMSPPNLDDNIIDPETDCTLEFVKSVSIIPGTAVSIRFTPNSPYDPDPLFASAAVPGFAERAAFYNFYRTIWVSYRIEFVNLEFTPCMVYTHLTNGDPTTTMPITAVSNPLAKWRLLSSAGGGGDHACLTDRQTVATILGSNEVEYNEQYRALVSASPADLVWLGIGFHLTSGVGANGVGCIVTIRMRTRFFDRQTNLTTFKNTSLLEAENRRLLVQLKDKEEKERAMRSIIAAPASATSPQPVPIRMGLDLD